MIPKAEKSMLPEVLTKCLETDSNLDSHINTINLVNLLFSYSIPFAWLDSNSKIY